MDLQKDYKSKSACVLRWVAAPRLNLPEALGWFASKWPFSGFLGRKKSKKNFKKSYFFIDLRLQM